MKHLTYLTFLLASTSVMSAPIAVPNNFVAGTPALAAEVNDNFSTIANGINVNDSRMNIMETDIAAAKTAQDLAINANTAAIAANALNITDNTDEIAINVFNTAANAGDIAANSSRLDTLENVPAPVIPKTFRVSATTNAGIEEIGTLLSVNGNTLSYISDKGYAFSPVDMTNGVITNTADLYYKVSGCVATSAEPAYSLQVPKVVFSNAGSKYYTTEKTGTTISILILSKRVAGGACQSYGITVHKLYKAWPNNHVVTGGGFASVHSFK